MTMNKMKINTTIIVKRKNRHIVAIIKNNSQNKQMNPRIIITNSKPNSITTFSKLTSNLNNKMYNKAQASMNKMIVQNQMETIPKN